ncbi:MAG: hypothetical protein HQL71_00885 [Magnetococcales bacterium]|nr:hypothetical protein [Magnetococcales bacterium]
MSQNSDEFNDCPQGEEVDGFHHRIIDGLTDSIKENEDRYLQIKKITDENRDEDEKIFFVLYNKIKKEMLSIQNSDISYDKKYEMAQSIRADINEIELL